VIGRHDLDLGAHAGPECTQCFDRHGVAAVGRCEDAPAVDEEFGEAGIGSGMLGAGDGMGRNEMNVIRQMRCHLANDRGLDRTDIGHDRAGLEERRDLLRDRSASADRNAEDHEVGVRNRFRVGFQHAVDDAEFGHPRAGFFRARGGDDFAGEPVRPRGARDRAADQAEADQRDASEDRRRVHLPAMKSRRPSTTRRLASSVPMVMRSE
jgi:hypothetical protein